MCHFEMISNYRLPNSISNFPLFFDEKFGHGEKITRSLRIKGRKRPIEKNLRFFGGFNKLDFGHLSSSIQKFSKMKENFTLILFADYGLSQLFSVGFDTPVAQGLIDSL